MTLREALQAAINESRKLTYDTSEEGKYYYNTPTESKQSKKGNCVDAAILALSRAHELMGGQGNYYLVIGDTFDGERHAWIEADDGNETLWGEAVPPIKEYKTPTLIASPKYFSRKPLWAYKYNGKTFDEKFEYK